MVNIILQTITIITIVKSIKLIKFTELILKLILNLLKLAKNQLFWVMSPGLLLVLLLPIPPYATAENQANPEDYYSILQPGIHPSAPLGYPQYKANETQAFSNTSNYSQTNSPTTMPTPTTDNFEVNFDNTEKSDDYYKALKEEAFERLLNTKVPLTPEQIIRLNKELDKTSFATKTSPTTPPQPVSSTVNIDLSPGSTPPIVRLSSGFVSSLVFIDSTGQPWPISDYSLGNPQEINIQWDQKTNALFVQSTAPYVTANLAIRLDKLDTPIMISLVTGQRQVDYRVDFQLNAHGPNALPPIGATIYPGFSVPPSLLKVLDGTPPAESRELQVSGNLGRAWLHQGKVIFRTNLVVISPAWNSTVSSADGTKVYEFTQTPFILASKDGKTIKIEITGF